MAQSAGRTGKRGALGDKGVAQRRLRPQRKK